MASRLAEILRLKHPPLAIVLAEEKPDGALQFKGGNRGCVAAMLLAATRGRTVAFARATFGCPGGGVGLGFGDTYAGTPVDRLLSTGGRAELPGGRTWDMGAGERFFGSPETARRWMHSLPFREIPAAYVLARPLDETTGGDTPALVWLLANPDQISALVTQIGFRRGSIDNVVAPWCAACQSILFAYAECAREQPRAVLGFFDISQRHSIDRDLFSLTIPYGLFLEMEAGAEDSFFQTGTWRKLRERQ